MAYNVLIVDDSNTIRTIIAKALRHADVPLGEVLFARDGLEALETLKDNWVDLIFADLNMPRLSGVEMVERMADNDLLSSVPVVIVSTEGRQERIDALKSRGIAAYLRKPFTPQSVARITLELLGGFGEAPRPVDGLAEAFMDAIEGFAMIVAEPVDGHPPVPLRAVLTTLKATGPAAELEMAIATSDEGARLIAEAALGEEGGSAEDALGELLNIVCGRLVDTIPGGPFDFEPPVSVSIEGDAAWLKLCQMAQCQAFDAEGLPLGVALTRRDRWQ